MNPAYSKIKDEKKSLALTTSDQRGETKGRTGWGKGIDKEDGEKLHHNNFPLSAAMFSIYYEIAFMREFWARNLLNVVYLGKEFDFGREKT